MHVFDLRSTLGIKSRATWVNRFDKDSSGKLQTFRPVLDDANIWADPLVVAKRAQPRNHPMNNERSRQRRTAQPS